MIVLHTSTSYAPRAKASITRSSSSSGIWPWATASRASGTRRARWLAMASIVRTRL